MTTDATAQSTTIKRRRNAPSGMTIAGLCLVGLVLLWLGINAVKTPGLFFEDFLIGITVGAIYALVALGYTLVYGILELINFANGDVFMLGAMVAATVLSGKILGHAIFNLKGTEGAATWLPEVLITLFVCMAFCGILNASIEFVAYRPLRGAPRLAPLITAIGMSFILQNVAIAWKGPDYVTVPPILPTGDVFSIRGVSYEWNSFIVLLVTVPILLLLMWLVQKTRQGKAMRATAQDNDAAAMMGINVNRTISFTFLLAGGLAGTAGLVYALFVTNVRFDQGFQLGLIAFTAAVLGGIGNLPGAVLGAVLIGLIQAFNEGLTWHAPGSDWTQSIVFSILILILVFRPEGLLGERTPEGG